jgi:hypothetical protein
MRPALLWAVFIYNLFGRRIFSEVSVVEVASSYQCVVIICVGRGVNVFRQYISEKYN